MEKYDAFMTRLKRTHQRQMKPVQVGDKKYESIKAAAKDNDVSATTVISKIKKKEKLNGMDCFYLKKGQIE